MTTLWIVGQNKRETKSGIVWELQGVFDDKNKAEAACRNESYFIGPANLNEILSDQTEMWPGCYYPRLSK
jgi:hypothetical protein